MMVFQPPQASHLPDHLAMDGAAGLADEGGEDLAMILSLARPSSCGSTLR